jgi:hypothetical protein
MSHKLFLLRNSKTVKKGVTSDEQAPASRVAPRGRSRRDPAPHPPLSSRSHRRAPPGKARVVPAAAGLPLPARLGDPAVRIRPAAVRLRYCPLSGEVDLWVTRPEFGTSWKMASSSMPGRRPPPRAAQGRARSGLRWARRAYGSLDLTWPARLPLEVLLKVWLSCSAAAVRAAVGVRARSGSGGPRSGGAS